MTSVVLLVALMMLTGAALRVAWSAAPVAMARSRIGPRSEVAAVGLWRSPPGWVVARAEQAAVRVEVIEQAWPVAVVSALIVLAAAAALFAVPGLVVAGATVVASPAVALQWLALRERRRRAEALPVLLEDLARGLRSGMSLRQALTAGVDRCDVSLRPGLRTVCDTVAGGGSLEMALESWSARGACDGLALAVAALCLGIDAGGAHGRALDGVAATLRDRFAVDRELAALASQARASAGVMTVAPLLFAVFTVSADPRTAHFLLGTAAGLTCLGSGLVLDALAGWWMLRITGAERCDS